MSVPPTGTVTLLFTDIEGSTRLWERNETAMRSALARHDEILQRAIEEHNGFVFKTVGDAFCAAFGSAPDALEAALAIQRVLLDEPWEEKCAIRARVALHTGTAEERGGDYFGPPVNRVARLLSAGHGGQTLVSGTTKVLVEDVLPRGAELRDLGERHLKDLLRPERIFEVLAPGLPSGFPALKTLDARRNNLPPQPTPLVGREREVGEVCEVLRRGGTRLLTLTGPGGTGKTRLALQAAAEVLDEHENGAFFIPLASTSDPDRLVPAVAGGFGITESGDAPLADLLKEYLGRREMLLLLDNFEQLLPAAPLVGELLSAAPRLRILATSRTPLGIYGEREYAVPPLSVPDPRRLPPLEAIAGYEAVRLFVERAQAAKAGFVLTEENAPDVAEICARLDGLPLAVELAAARVKLLPPKALLVRLSNRLKLLTGGARDLPERQRTLRGTIEWSHDLLDEGEKTLFARLAVFSGGCTLEAVEAMCDAEGDLPVDPLDGISSLLEKSLLRREEDPDGEPRFVMLETIHEYARDKLEESGESEDLRRLHAGYFLALAEEAEPELVGPDQVAWMDRLEAEHNNIRAALSWAIGREDNELALDICGALWWFWSVRGHWQEGIRWCEEGLRNGEGVPSPVRAKALLAAGALMYKRGDLELSVERLEQAQTLYRQAGHKRGAATCLGYLGTTWIDRGDWEKAKALSEESLALARETDSPWDTCSALNELSVLAAYRGDLERAKVLAEEALEISKRTADIYATAATYTGLAWMAMLGGDNERAEALLKENLPLLKATRNRVLEANALNNLALLSLLRGDHDRAAALASHSLRLSDEVLDRYGVSISLDALAAVCAGRGDVLGAARLWGAAEALREIMGIPRPPDDEKVLEPFLRAARTHTDKSAWNAAWEVGRALGSEEAVAQALEVSGTEAATELPLRDQSVSDGAPA